MRWVNALGAPNLLVSSDYRSVILHFAEGRRGALPTTAMVSKWRVPSLKDPSLSTM